MTAPGDSSPSTSPVEPAPAEPEPAGRLSVTVLEEGGDWSQFVSREEAIASAAAAMAREPRCARARGAEACVVLADDSLLRSLNRAYRGKDAPTNVLSFPFQNAPGAAAPRHLGPGAAEPRHLGPGAAEPRHLGPGAAEPRHLGPGAAEPRHLGPGAAEPRHLGDVVLAAETLRREAAEQGIPPAHHLQHLVVHGLLHLLGFDHDTEAQAEAMERLEAQILGTLGVPDPYAAA
ncbi:MAG TPA: rRNA maturation RNase YbeY [Hyphomicrobiaceae bacterium]|jgi:probable rRNA maturation factor